MSEINDDVARSSSLHYGRWQPPIRTNLADLDGVYIDLFSARRFAIKLSEVCNTQPIDYILIDALFTATIIRYARPFASGVRQRLEAPPLSIFSVDEQRQHEHLLAIRNKHIAHPVNRFETNSIYIGFTPDDPTSAKATSISSGTHSYMGPSESDAESIRVLSEKWMEYVLQLTTTEQTNLLTYAQKLSSEELVGLPRGPVELHDDPNKHRRKT